MTALAHAPLHAVAQRDVRYSHPQNSQISPLGLSASGLSPSGPGSVHDSDEVRLEFFGIGIRVRGSELPDFEFQCGPHLCSGSAPESAALHINLMPLVGRSGEYSPSRKNGGPSWGGGPVAPVSGGSDLAREMTVARADGVIVLRRTFRGWSNVPPPVPPFAAMADRYSVTPAVVLAKGDRVLALLGSPHSSKAGIALALVQHGWRFVSGQLLVTDRRTGRTMPFLAPIELRGSAAAQVRSRGLSARAWRTRASALGGEILQVRPEALGGVVPVRSQGGPATLVRLCDSADGKLSLRAAEHVPQSWPTEARTSLRYRGTFALQMPGEQAAEEAANRLDAEFAPLVSEDRTVVPIKASLPGPRG